MARRSGPQRGRPPGEAPEYERIAAALRARMHANEWPPGAILPSIRKLAQRYRAGPSAVRLALEVLKSEHRVGLGMSRRLVALNPVGASLAFENIVLEVQRNLLGNLLGNSAMRALQAGLEAGVSRLLAPLLIAHDSHFREYLPQALPVRTLRGILLVGPVKAPLLKQYERLPVPVVLVDQASEGLALHSVSVDNRRGAAAATRRLLALGHRRIAFLRRATFSLRDVDPDSREREAGYLDALQEAGLSKPEELPINIVSQERHDGPTLQVLFRAAPRFTAFLAADGWIAQLCLEAAQARGLAVPRDLSIACFQDLQTSRPELSGPRTDFEALGLQAALLLKEPRRPAQHLRIAAAWEDGATAGRAPGM